MSTPVDDRLFSSLDPLLLAGSECTDCGTTTFPVQADCPQCARRTMRDVELPAEGVLWTWTLQAFEPKPPYVAPADGFRPFPVGYVDLGTVMVEARLDADPADLGVGTPMRLVPFDVLTSSQDRLLGYAFAPATGAGAAS
jgi:uncharacterized OB-fold protein